MTAELTLSDIEARIEDFTDADLALLEQDERTGARDLVARERARRAAASAPDPNDNPRLDPGPSRYEDRFDTVIDTPLSSPEVDLEDQRKDETTVLATDVFDSEGNRVNQ